MSWVSSQAGNHNLWSQVMTTLQGQHCHITWSQRLTKACIRASMASMQWNKYIDEAKLWCMMFDLPCHIVMWHIDWKTFTNDVWEKKNWYRVFDYLFIYGAGDWTQAVVPSRQAGYHLISSLKPLFSFWNIIKRLKISRTDLSSSIISLKFIQPAPKWSRVNKILWCEKCMNFNPESQ